MTFGINVDMRFATGRGEPLGGFQGLYDQKVRGLRYTSFSSVTSYGAQAQAVGLKCLVIVTSESQGFVFDGNFTPDYVQLGNEPDASETVKEGMRKLSVPHPRLTMSTYTPPSDFADYWVIYRNTYQNLADQGVPFFSPGLCSGGQNAADYWQAVIDAIGNRAPMPDAIAIHPYNKTPDEAAGDFDLMWNQFQIPIIATEWFRDAQSNQMWDFIAMLNDHDTGRSQVWNSFFCLDDTMVNGFGLCSNGNPKDEWYSLMSSPSIP